MGLDFSRVDKNEKVDKLLPKEINTKQFLLFGANDSGKSTLFRAIKKVTNPNNWYTKEEVLNQRYIIYENVIRALFNLSKYCYENKQLTKDEESLVKDLFDFNDGYVSINEKLCKVSLYFEKIKKIWSIPVIKSALDNHQNELYIFDNAR